MKSNKFTSIFFVGLLSAVFMLFSGCKTQPTEPIFNPHIVGFTSGNISVKSPIRIRLSDDVAGFDLNTPIDKKLFNFSPGIKGAAYLIDNQTVEFRPDEMLDPGKEYQVTFKLSEVNKSVEKDFKSFDFSFTTIKQAFHYSVEGLQMYSQEEPNLFYLKGYVTSYDYVDIEKIEQALAVNAERGNAKVVWTHESDTRHQFVIDSIKGGETAYLIKLDFNGKSINYDFSKKEEIRVPSIYEFSLLNVQVNNGEQQSVVCQFSSPIDKNQNLRGLITLGGNTVNFKVDLNTVTVFPGSKIMGGTTLTIHAGIKNAAGGKFSEAYTQEIVFEDLKPEVKYINKGTIIPNSNGLILPFQAVSLKAVIVKVIKVYEKNVLQFFQVNQFDGTREMKRAGRLVALKTMKLGEENSPELTRWSTYAIDLSTIINPEPGAIYRVELSFQHRHAIYPCLSFNNGDNNDSNESDEGDYYDPYSNRNNDSQDESLTDEEMFIQQEAGSDSPARGGYYYDDYESDYYYYDYENRNNPCHAGYYGGRRVARNIIASDMGIVAKMGETNTCYVSINNLVSLAGMGGVEVQLYNYQQVLIGSAKTDNDGNVMISFKGRPFVLVAKSDKQRGYLRLDDGTALSTSNFEVSGSVIEKGLKGYIYGERGVWRPGDTLHLGFILQDREKRLPANHPVNLEIINSRGQLVTKQTKTTGSNGVYTFAYKTDDNAPTGNWTANIKVGGTSFSKTLKIETIKPNRLKVDLKFDSDPIVVNSQKITGKLSSKWLHGAPARNLAYDIKMSMRAIKTTFAGFENFVFDSPVRQFSSEEKDLTSGRLNENGDVNISANFSVKGSAPGKLQAIFTTRVFEEGGEFSIDNMSATVMPYTSFVGLQEPKGTGYRNMLETDKDQTYNIAVVDANGKSINRERIAVSIYKLGWSWWWNSSNNQLANYAQGSYQTPVYTTTVNSTNGKANFSFKAEKDKWGFYLVTITDPVSRHSTGVVSYIDWPSWGGRPRQQDGGDGATSLMFSANKDKYNVGEKATITFPSSEGSKAIVSIESGTKVLRTMAVTATGSETSFNLDITPEMLPNVYAYITLIQPHAQTANDAPIRLYGVIPIMVEDPKTKLQPVIDMPDKLRPEEKFTIKVSEKSKQGMSYTLAIVDEGLLDLTRFKTPNAWDVFFAKEALGVKTWDMYDAVIGAYGGKIDQLFAIGGDDEGGENARSKINRFKPVVLYLGPFTLGSGSTNKHDLELPNYVGSVRVMVVASGDMAYGNAEKTVPVNKPLMAMATLPRVLGPGEEVDLPATIFAMDPSIKKVKVEVQTNDMFTVVDGDNKSLNFSSVGDEVTTFRLKVKDRVGKGTVKVIASSGGEKSEYDIEIEVRNANPRMARSFEQIIEAGKTATMSYTLPGMEGTNKGILEVSSMPPLNLGKRLNFLLAYPHGCLEQTTSGAFPQLYLKDIMELSKEEIARAEINVKAGIERIKLFVTLEGGFSYWPGERYPNMWATSYVGHFLLEAELKGYTIPQNVKKGWVKYQKREASNWKKAEKKGNYYTYGQNDFDQAYRLYTLALAKESDMGAMNRLKAHSDLSVQARWALASAYALAGQTKTAKEIIEKTTDEISPYSGFSQSFGSAERDWAIILDALTVMKEQQKGFEIVKRISKSLNTDRWMSTQTTAYCLMALSKFAVNDKGANEVNMEYTHSGTSEKAKTMKPVWQNSLTKLTDNGSIKITNNASNVLFSRIHIDGIPVAGEEVAAESNLKISVSYIDAANKSIDVSKLKQGTDFEARVTISNTGVMGDYTNMALSQIFPSGWEITTDRLMGMDKGGNYDYRDIRDDRVYTYFGLASGKSKIFKVKLNASYTGKFYLPAASCEAMYDNTIHANNKGQWVEITK